MRDQEFFDLLYQEWSKTTGAGEKEWIVEEDVFYPGWGVWAVNPVDDTRESIASFDNEADADFAATIHGCLADLVRRLNDALDEADRADERRDEAEQKLAEEIMLSQELSLRLEGLEQ